MRSAPITPAGRLPLTLIVALLLVAACGTGSPSPRPTTTLPSATDPVGLTPAPPPTSRPRTAAPTTPVVGSWPDGWDADFCSAFAEVVPAQELAVDVGRALDEDDDDDALGLARELESSGEAATEMLANLPQWEPAQAAVDQLTELMDMAQRMGRSYRRFMEDNRGPALERAQGIGAEMRPLVDSVLADLGVLSDEEGLGCPGMEFALESP